MFSESPIQKMQFAGRDVYVKRDDLLDDDFSGNKARKFYSLLVNNQPNVSLLIGYGSAQANSLYSLSVLAKRKGWQFDYYVSELTDTLKQIDPIAPGSASEIQSNYHGALLNDANIIPLNWRSLGVKNLDDAVKQQLPLYLSRYRQDQILFVEEGGRMDIAQQGVYLLGQEILDWAKRTHQDDLVVFLPSGTGTTALFLNEFFCEMKVSIQVVTCSCVGGDDYLTKQFAMLSDNKAKYPQIINFGKKYHFGKLYLDNFYLWQQVLDSTGIEFDLLYDTVGLYVFKKAIENNMFKNKSLMYLHQGGLLGNKSMLRRYMRKIAAITKS